MFLYPLFLAGLAVAILPIIAHLFLRPRAKVVRFPMLRFLVATRVDQRNWRRLKDILLLLLRIAILALIVLMFAQPCLTGGGAGPQHLVLVLDDTLSMEYGQGRSSCFADAVSQAVALLNRMGHADRASIISLTGKSGSAIGLDRGAAVEQVRRMEVLPLAADPVNVLAHVADAAQAVGPGMQKGLYFISDLQKIFWGRLGPAQLGKDCELDFVRALKAGPEDRPNQALVEAVSSRNAQGSTIRVRLANYSDAETRATLDARYQAVSLGRTNLALAAHSSQAFELPVRRPEGLDGALPVDVVMETEDNLAADNHFRLILPAEGKAAPRVLVVENVSGGAFFISKAIESLGLAPGGRVYEVETTRAEGLAERMISRAADGRASVPGGLPAYPLVIFQGLKGPAPELAAAFKALLDGGGVVLVFLNAELDVQVAGKLFQDGLLPLQPLSYERKDRRLAGVDSEGRFTKDLADSPSSEFMSYGAFAVKPAPAARVSGWLEGGVPLVAALECGAGQSVMINTSADAEMSDFVKTSLLLPFLAASLRSGIPASALPRRTGDRIRLAVAPGEQSLKVITPSGRAKVLPAEASANEALLEAEEAGFYRDASGRPLLAVNVPPEESDLQSFSESEAEDLLRSRCRIAGQAREVTRTGESLEGKLPLWRLLGFLTLALLAGELFLANRMKR